ISDTVDQVLERARSARPDLVAAEAQARAARATAQSASKAGLPTIEVAGTIGRTLLIDQVSIDKKLPGATNWQLALNLRIPLFDGFREKYSSRQAQALAEQAEASRDLLYRQTELDVWQAYYDVQTAATATTSTEAQVRSAEQH